MRSTCTAAALALVSLVAGCTSGGTTASRAPAGEPETQNQARPVAAALTGFDDCDDLTSTLRKEALAEVTAYGLPQLQPSWRSSGTWTSGTFGATTADATTLSRSALKAAVAPGSVSGTNNQESGVDEPDQVKTDGRVMVVATSGRSRLLVVDVSGSHPVQVGDLVLHLDDATLLLDGDTVVALGTATRKGRLVTVVEVVDLSDPRSPTALRRFRLDGGLVDARMVHGRVVVAVRSAPQLQLTRPTTGSRAAQVAALRANRASVQRATVAQLLPDVTVTPGGGSYRAACAAALRPGVASGLDRTSLITLDPGDPEPTQHVTVVGTSSVLYASEDALYLATTPFLRGGWAFDAVTRKQADTTDVHGFDLRDPDHLGYLGTGSVTGRLTDQYAMSEHEGYLRVATTTGTDDNRVTVLRPGNKVLEQVGQVAGFGKGESIYGVRFLGDRGYVVTFRQTDPLFVLDLSEPTRPRLRGHLEVTGYSASLFPLDDDRLLGIGQGSDAERNLRGTQASVFDVHDAAAPRLLGTTILNQSWTSAERDHHALLWWPKTRNVVMPLSANGFQGAVVLEVDRDGEIHETGRVRPVGNHPVLRAVVIGDLLYSVNDDGIATTPLDHLTEQAWLPFL